MNKRKELECSDKITVDITGLMAMLSCGKNTADKIGIEAGAAVKFGKRKLYIVKKVQEYMDSLAEQGV